MRLLVLVLGIGAVSMAGFCQQNPTAQADPQQSSVDEIPKVTAERSMSYWMAKKLELSKSILESLTKGDFETMAENAERMQRIGKLEGLVRRKKTYQTQLQYFELANQELVRHSSRRNVEGATLAFNQLTSSCVACHTLLREGVE